MRDPKTGEWIGPSSLEEVTGGEWRAQLQQVSALEPSPLMDEMFEALMAAIRNGDIPPERVASNPDLAFLWAKYGPDGAGEGEEEQEEEEGRE